ncbi:MAG: mechanosensitive ion channel domain-containing protein, partial [Novosphingobium sp.]
MTLQAHLPALLQQLDDIGFDYGHTRISLFRGIVVLAVVVLVFITGHVVNGVVNRMLRRLTRLDPTERLLGQKLAGSMVWLICILIGADIVGIDLTAFAVFSGAFGLAIGFGLQKTFGNLLAGIILLMDRSIKPGDVIAVGGSSGTVGEVKRIGVRAVSVITRDKIEYLIPNETLMTSQVENWSYSSREVRIKVPVSLADGSDIDQAEQLILQAARDTPRVLAKPRPDVWLRGFGANAIEFEIQLWIIDPENGIGNLRSDLLKRLYRLFRDNGIALPGSQHDIHVKEWPAAPAAGEMP